VRRQSDRRQAPSELAPLESKPVIAIELPLPTSFSTAIGRERKTLTGDSYIPRECDRVVDQVDKLDMRDCQHRIVNIVIEVECSISSLGPVKVRSRNI
jgi:hypothetical protein